MKGRRDTRSMKEGAARAVLREAWLRGHRCVELQRDGKRTIFVCTRCNTRCYSDAALVDHLRGNLHSRLSAALRSGEKNYVSQGSNNGQERPIVARERERNKEVSGHEGGGAVVQRTAIQGGPQIMLAGPSRTSLEWIGGVELFFNVRAGGATPVVESSWFCWKERDRECHGPESVWPVRHGGAIFYAIVMFPYSDMIGRGGDWKSWMAAEPKSSARGLGNQLSDALPSGQAFANPQTTFSTPEDVTASTGHGAAPTENVPSALQSTVDKITPQSEMLKKKHALGRERETSGSILRRACKRKKARAIERLCFICHQKMVAGKDVAALLNLQTKQMVCGSRNKRGVFHVYHCSCLIDWISICELKTFTGQLDHRIDRTRKLTRTRHAIMEQSLQQGSFGDEGMLSNANSESNIFCPECQGTGLNLRGSQLERPRYRLAQVFDWILELIQARKAWTDNPKNLDTSRCGLLFREETQAATTQSRGVVRCYSGCAELLTGNVLDR